MRGWSDDAHHFLFVSLLWCAASVAPQRMPEYLAVQCFSCEAYQVVQATKRSVFTCKLCGEKQSVRGVHGRSGRAQDVRTVVSALNWGRGTAQEAALAAALAPAVCEAEQEDSDFAEPAPSGGRGLWAQYLEEPQPERLQEQPDDDWRFRRSCVVASTTTEQKRRRDEATCEGPPPKKPPHSRRASGHLQGSQQHAPPPAVSRWACFTDE